MTMHSDIVIPPGSHGTLKLPLQNGYSTLGMPPRHQYDRDIIPHSHVRMRVKLDAALKVFGLARTSSFEGEHMRRSPG